MPESITPRIARLFNILPLVTHEPTHRYIVELIAIELNRGGK